MGGSGRKRSWGSEPRVLVFVGDDVWGGGSDGGVDSGLMVGRDFMTRYWWLVVAVSLVVVSLLAAEAVKCESGKWGEEVCKANRLEVINSYQRAVIAQTQVQQAQQALQAAVAAYNAEQAKQVKEVGFQEGTTFVVDIGANTATPQSPKSAEVKK